LDYCFKLHSLNGCENVNAQEFRSVRKRGEERRGEERTSNRYTSIPGWLSRVHSGLFLKEIILKLGGENWK
jgi:hypothetical protein